MENHQEVYQLPQVQSSQMVDLILMEVAVAEFQEQQSLFWQLLSQLELYVFIL